MALGLSCGGGRRRWSCLVARRGGGGCRHFHVQCRHVPRSQVCACFPLPRLPPRVSLLHGVLFLPVLCFAVLAFLVFFGWFTLVYFVNYSLMSEEGGGGRDLGGGDGQGGEEEERDVRRVTESAADSDSYFEDVCIEAEEIKEVFVDGFFDRSKAVVPRMVSPNACVGKEEDARDEEFVEDVMILETDRQGLRALSELYGSSGRRQVKEIPFDCFMEELEIREFVPSPDAAELLDAQCGEEFVVDRKEVPSPIDEFVYKHETRAVVNGSAHDLEIVGEVDSADGSVSHGLGSDHEEIKQELNMLELDASSVPDKLPEVVCESMEDSKRQILGISDEVHSFSNETESSGLLLNSIYLAARHTNTDEGAQPEHEEEPTENNRVEPSGMTSLVCEFAESHQTMKEEISASASEDNVREDTSLETSVSERTEYEDEKIDYYCTPKGASPRLPLVRRSPVPWWNLCGVLDVLGGCKK